MLATLAGLSSRLVTELSGALHMHAAIEDPMLALWAVVRVLSSGPIPEEPGGTEGWNLSPAQVAKGELFCVFGTGANASCVVNFEVSRRPRLASGPRRQRGQAVGLQGRASARAGAHVAFKDSNGDVLRGVILTMSLYVPSQGKCLAGACGGQTVLFAYVFVAIRMSWAMVVTHRQNRTPFQWCPLTRSRLPVEQTLYESLHTAVEGFPQAVVVDAEVVQCAKQAHSAELARVNQTSANVMYWQLTVVPTDRCPQTVRELWDFQGGCRSCSGSSFWEVASLYPTLRPR